MLDWMKGRRSPGRHHPTSDTGAPEPDRVSISGKAAPLHKYLNERFADSVVLTFGEIEDLIGFALPERAGLSDDWWTAPAPDSIRLADAWILANRTARPSLSARTVVFDRRP